MTILKLFSILWVVFISALKCCLCVSFERQMPFSFCFIKTMTLFRTKAKTSVNFKFLWKSDVNSEASSNLGRENYILGASFARNVSVYGSHILFSCFHIFITREPCNAKAAKNVNFKVLKKYARVLSYCSMVAV